jgi:hypothetical protein
VALRCLKEGGPHGASPENIRNQIIDAMLAAYGTYFDELLSDDRRAREIYETTNQLLKFYHHDIQAFKGSRSSQEIEATA